MNADHVVLKNDGLHCRHCGGFQPKPLPEDIQVLLSASKPFLEKHRACLKPIEARP